MRIVVTSKDIKNGIATASTLCPVARAIKRRFNANVFVTVYSTYVIFTKGKLKCIITTTDRVEEFINKFDSGKPVKPIQFTLKLPVCLKNSIKK